MANQVSTTSDSSYASKRDTTDHCLKY